MISGDQSKKPRIWSLPLMSPVLGKLSALVFSSTKWESLAPPISWAYSENQMRLYISRHLVWGSC